MPLTSFSPSSDALTLAVLSPELADTSERYSAVRACVPSKALRPIPFSGTETSRVYTTLLPPSSEPA